MSASFVDYDHSEGGPKRRKVQSTVTITTHVDGTATAKIETTKTEDTEVQ